MEIIYLSLIGMHATQYGAHWKILRVVGITNMQFLLYGNNYILIYWYQYYDLFFHYCSFYLEMHESIGLILFVRFVCSPAENSFVLLQGGICIIWWTSADAERACFSLCQVCNRSEVVFTNKEGWKLNRWCCRYCWKEKHFSVMF